MNQTPETRSNSPEKKPIQHIMELALSKVRDTEDYARLRGTGKSHPLAFQEVAETVAQNEENELNEADRALLSVVAKLGVFTEAQNELDLLHKRTDGRRMTDEERWVMNHLKRTYAIPFNHALKDLVNTHPNDDLRGTSSALANARDIIFGRYTSLDPKETMYQATVPQDSVLEGIQGALNGMRHEVAAEGLIGAIGYEFDYNVTVDEDGKGADIFVYLESGWEPVDIKASMAAAEKDHEKHPLSKAVWTGLGWEDFTGQRGDGHGTLSAPYATLEAKGGQFIESIYAMAEHNRAIRSAAAQQAGRQSVRRK